MFASPAVPTRLAILCRGLVFLALALFATAGQAATPNDRALRTALALPCRVYTSDAAYDKGTV